MKLAGRSSSASIGRSFIVRRLNGGSRHRCPGSSAADPDRSLAGIAGFQYDPTMRRSNVAHRHPEAARGGPVAAKRPAPVVALENDATGTSPLERLPDPSSSEWTCAPWTPSGRTT